MGHKQFSPSLQTELRAPNVVVAATDRAEEAAPPVEGPGPESWNNDAREVGPSSDTETAASDSDWRDQVSAKVNSYKSRRPRTDRYPSLQLQFDTGAYRGQKSEARPNAPPSFSESVAAEVRNL